MSRIGTCLWFDNQGEEAAKFYVSIFPNSRIVETARYNEVGPGEPGSVMSVAFELDGADFMVINGGPIFQLSPAMSITVDCADQAEVDYYWKALLADGGRESQCGWLADRFGLSWQVVPRRLRELMSDPDKAKVARVNQAMLKMVKLDVATLEAAAAS